MAVVKWARENGALHIKVDGIEVVFPPNMPERYSSPRLTPDSIIDRASREPGFDKNAPDAVTSQHPDEYAAQSDSWASYPPKLR